MQRLIDANALKNAKFVALQTDYTKGWNRGMRNERNKSKSHS